MKLIEAAENGYATANSWFLLLWSILAIVSLTTFFEVREIENDRFEAREIQSRYAELIGPSEAVATALERAVAASPYPNDPKALFAELRANALRSRHLLVELDDIIAAGPGIGSDAYRAIRKATIRLQALLYFNEPSLAEGDFPPIPDQPKLLLVEFDIGTIGIADTVPELRIGDAAKLLWLTTIPMRDMMANAPQMRRYAASSNREDGNRLARLMIGFENHAMQVGSREEAEELWIAWLKALPSADDTPEARLQRSLMQTLSLKDPSELTTEALRTLSLADSRQSGAKVDVSLPGLSLPIRLSDALIFLPVLVGVCLLAIYVYTSRGLRYGTPENLEAEPEHKMVGKTPVYFALYGVSRNVGWLIAALALALPLAITMALPLCFLPSALSADWANSVFWIGLGIDTLLLFALLLQISKVTELIEAGSQERLR